MKTSEREFLLFVSLREILLQHIHLQKNTQTYLSLILSAKTPSEQSGMSSSISVPKIRTLYGFPNNKCCTDFLDFCAKNSAKTVRKNQQENTLKLVPTSSKNVPKIFGLYGPWFLCKSVWIVWISSPRKNVPSRLLEICANKSCVTTLGCVPTHSEFAAAVLDFCAH